MNFRKALFWLLIASAGALAAGPAGSAAKRTVAAVRAKACWRATLASDHPVPAPGEPAAWISIPSVKLGVVVLQEVSPENLEKYPCVVRWPGRGANDPGLTVILGHRDTHFRPLERLEKGATITLTHRDGSKTSYRVIAIQITTPDAAREEIQDRMDGDELVLMTCYPFRYLGSAPQRILFWASPVVGKP